MTLSRTQLLDGAWDIAFESRSNVVDVYVRYLREKIDRPFGRHSIETIRGVGYRLRASREQRSVSRIPIRLRLTLGFAVAMAVVLAAVGLFVYRRVANELLATVDQTLLGAGPGGEPAPASVDADTGSGPTLAQLFGPHGQLRQLAAERGSAPLVGTRRRRRGGRRAAGLARRAAPAADAATWRVLVRPAPARDGVVVLARSLESRDESLDHLRHELLIFLPLALLAASLGGYCAHCRSVAPRRALAPSRGSGDSGRAEPGCPCRRPETRSRGSRVTLNDMLARLQAAVEHERRFVADASHELRTPLALLRTELDLALRRPRSREELESALRSAADETQRLSRLADDLLLIARADQGPLPIRREVVAAGDLLADAATRFANRATLARAGASSRGDGPPRRRRSAPRRSGAREPRRQRPHARRRHGRAAGRGTRTAWSELHVSDAGSGFPREFRDRAFDRFSRADEARSGGGSGLGLSIVELVATAHGGGVGLSDSAAGGADVWISLPRADVPDGASGRSRAAGEADHEAAHDRRDAPLLLEDPHGP